jgi:hypothetical protein
MSSGLFNGLTNYYFKLFGRIFLYSSVNNIQTAALSVCLPVCRHREQKRKASLRFLPSIGGCQPQFGL